MRFGWMIIPAALAVTGCQQPSDTPARMSAEQAEVHCTKLANQYANTPLLIPDESGTIQVGLLAELPDSFMVTDFYKQCFFANAKQRPTSIPKIQAFG